MPYVDARPAGLDLSFRPGTTITVTFLWPSGSLVGRTFSAELAGVALTTPVSVVGDVMTVVVTDTETTARGFGVHEFELLEEISGTDEAIVVGDWTGSNRAAASSSTTLEAVGGAVEATVIGGPAAFSPDLILPAPTFPGDGTVEGGIIRRAHSIQIPWNYTHTTSPTDPAIGTAVHVRSDVTVAPGGPSNPSFSTGNFGPRGIFNFEGDTVYARDMDAIRIAPLGFVDTLNIRNDDGQARILAPAWSHLSARRVSAHGATVTLEVNDTNAGGASFASHEVYRTFDDGLIDGQANACGVTAFHCSAGWQGVIDIHHRYGLHVGASAELTGAFSDAPDATVTDEIGVKIDAFTIGTNRLGVWSSPPIVADDGFFGGRDASDNLVLGSTMHATRGRIEVRDPVDLITEDKTFTATPIQLLAVPSGRILTLDVASWAFRAYDFAATIVAQQGSGTFQSLRFLNANPTVKNANGVGLGINGPAMFQSAPVFQADGATLTLGVGLGSSGFMDNPAFGVINAGTLAIDEWASFRAAGSVNASATMTTRMGFRAQDPGGAGTIATNIGVDIAALAKGATNIGIRNASTYVALPSAQTIDAAADTIAPTAELVELTNPTGGAITVTSTPTIANGQPGQILELVNVGAQNIVLQHGASFNLRLAGATNRTLTPGDSLRLYYSSVLGDWVELGRADT